MRVVAPMPQEGGPRIPQNSFLFKRRKSPKTLKLRNVQKYDKISNTPFNQRSLIHRETWFPGGPRIPKNLILLKNGKNHPKPKNSKHLEICQNQRYALGPEVSNPSGSVVSTMFCKAKSATKKIKKIARQFQTTFKQKCSNLRPLLSITFPQGF